MTLYWIFFILFLISNFFILKSDIQEKKIPNKYLFWLLLLFPIFFLIDIFTTNSFSFLFILNIFISFIISFILYYFGIWSAGDAKYLLVLSLFIPKFGIIPFIGNIGLITIFYLLIYFIYFYIKIIFNKHHRKSLGESIWTEQKNRITTFLKHPISGKIDKLSSTMKILKQVLYFLVFFISLRLLRLDIINGIKELDFVESNINHLKSYFIIIIGGISFLIIFSYKFILKKIKLFYKYILEKSFKNKAVISEEKIKVINLILTLFFLIFIIFFDYIRNGDEIFHKLELILTLYLCISILIKILLYAYRLTFQIGEQMLIPIEKLEKGEIVDKNYLVNIFGTQECLGYKQEEGLLSPNPRAKIQKIENPLNEDAVNLLKKIYLTTNNYHKKNKTPNFSELKTLKILKTFAFGPYIFAGFLLTIIFGDLVGIILSLFGSIFINFIHH